MNRAPGHELEKRLDDVPREKIRTILDQVARAAIFLRGHKLCHRDIKSANVFVSEDFELATLLDLSVARDIYDPIGSGTDHDGQLPVVATARYSPPEYLFRLLDPGLELWHALDVYQLGALLHDLIMKKPLFQDEYEKSRENRYRFAWIIATSDPQVVADDVDQDLVLLARRALDKDWTRRSKLRLEEFLADSDAPRTHSMQLLGLGLPQPSGVAPGESHQRLMEVARSLEEGLRERLRQQRVTATHRVEPGDNDAARRIILRWAPPQQPAMITAVADNEFVLDLAIVEAHGGLVLNCSSQISATVEGVVRQAKIDMPSVADSADAALRLLENASAALERLAVELARARGRGRE
jgi:serine/threonine protein kinase